MATLPLLLAILGVLLLRWQGGDHPVALALIGLTPWTVAGIVPALLGAALSRSRVLGAAAVATAVGVASTMSPVGAVIDCGPEPYDTADTLTLYSHNVLFDADGGQPDAIADTVVAEQADVLVLQEVRWPLLDGFRNDPRMDAYPYRSDELGGTADGVVIWSRWPLTDVTTEWFVVSNLVSATVETPDGPVRVGDVHTQAPARPGYTDAWEAQFEQLGRIDTSTPRILAGDFNATPDHAPLRALLADGRWTDAQEVKGCGFDQTWPVDHGLPFPVYRLDHVLFTSHLEALDLRLGPGSGSDHLPVITEFRMRPLLGSRPVEG